MRSLVRCERGSITPFIAIVALGFLLLGGLVVDGARQLDSRGRALAYAEEAARAGVQRLLLQFGDVQLDEDLAIDAVQEYCDAAAESDPSLTDCRVTELVGQSDSPSNPVAVTVAVEVSVDPFLLGMIGVGSLDASAERSATPQQGIVEPDEEIELADPTVDVTNLDPSLGGPGTPIPPVTDPPCPLNEDDPSTPTPCDALPTVPNCDEFEDDDTLPDCPTPGVCDDDPNTDAPSCVEETDPPEEAPPVPCDSSPGDQDNDPRDCGPPLCDDNELDDTYAPCDPIDDPPPPPDEDDDPPTGDRRSRA